MTAEVVRTLSAYGPRRFYVLNTGVSTVRALDPAAALLAADGVLMRYTNLGTGSIPRSRVSSSRRAARMPTRSRPR